MAELGVIFASLRVACNAWGLLSSQLSKNLLKGDTKSNEILRQLLLDKVHKLREELNSLRKKELVAAVSFMGDGYELYLKDSVEAKKQFGKARDAAQMAFGVVAELPDKMLATEIMLASVMHEFDDKRDTAVVLSLRCISRLNSLPEITNACGDYLKKGLVGKLWSVTGSANRRDSLKTLSEINRNILEFVMQNDPEFEITKWPSVQCDGVCFNPAYDLLLLRESYELFVGTNVCRTPVAIVVSGKSLFVAYSQLSATDSSKAYLEVININTFEVQPLPGHSAAILALVAINGKVFSASFDKSILVWDGSSPGLIQNLGGHDGSVRSLATSKTTLFSAGTDKLIKAWDLATYKPVGVFSGHQSPISLLCFTHNLFSYAPHEGIKIWNVTRGEVISSIPDPGNVSSMYCSVRSKLFVHCGMDIRIWNLGTLKEDKMLKGVGKYSAHLPGMKVVTTSTDQLMQYDLKTCKCLYDQPLKCTKSVDISVLHFNDESGLLYLGGVVKESREGIVMCI